MSGWRRRWPRSPHSAEGSRLTARRRLEQGRNVYVTRYRTTAGGHCSSECRQNASWALADPAGGGAGAAPGWCSARGADDAAPDSPGRGLAQVFGAFALSRRRQPTTPATTALQITHRQFLHPPNPAPNQPARAQCPRPSPLRNRFRLWRRSPSASPPTSRRNSSPRQPTPAAPPNTPAPRPRLHHQTRIFSPDTPSALPARAPAPRTAPVPLRSTPLRHLTRPPYRPTPSPSVAHPSA